RHAVGVAWPALADVAVSHHVRDLGPALEARERQAPRLKLFERRAVVIEMLGLPPHRALPRQAKPGEVLVDRRLELGPAAGRVDILHAPQEPPARRTRHVEIEQRRERVAEMQMPVRARREAEYGLRHGEGFATKPRA